MHPVTESTPFSGSSASVGAFMICDRHVLLRFSPVREAAIRSPQKLGGRDRKAPRFLRGSGGMERPGIATATRSPSTRRLPRRVRTASDQLRRTPHRSLLDRASSGKVEPPGQETHQALFRSLLATKKGMARVAGLDEDLGGSQVPFGLPHPLARVQRSSFIRHHKGACLPSPRLRARTPSPKLLAAQIRSGGT